MPVDDRLRQARGAGGEQRPQRMIERNLRVLELRRGDGAPPEERLPVHGVGQRQGVIVRIKVRQVDDVLERGQARGDVAQLRAAVEGLAAVAIAVDAEEHLRGQLGEAVERAALAEIRRAARPGRADGGGRQHRGHGLGDVRHPGDHPVAGHHAERAQLGRERAHAVAEGVPAECGEGSRLAHVQQHVPARGLAPQHVLRVVESRAREPLGPGHAAPAQHPGVRDRGLDVEVVPQGPPEALQVLDRPAPERAVVRKALATLTCEPLGEGRHVGAADPLRPRGPQEIAWLHASTHFVTGEKL